MMMLVRRRFGYKLISLLIAILFYLIAHNQQNPHATNEVYVQPEIVGLPEDLVVRTPPTGFILNVSGPAAAISTFKNETVKATVDVSRAHVGLNTRLPLQYKIPPDLDTDRRAVTEVTLERKSRQEYSVNVLFDDEPPAGKAYLTPVAFPRSAEVSGLKSDVDHVARVVAVVPRAQNAGEINTYVDLVAQNLRQQTIDTVEIDPPRVQVQLGLKSALSTKSLVLSAQLQGMPAPGFAISGYTFDPPAVTVGGEQGMLKDISALTVAVDVTGADASMDKLLPLSLPSGIVLENPEAHMVRVHVTISPQPGVASPSAAPIDPNKQTVRVPEAVSSPTVNAPAAAPTTGAR